MSTTQLSLMTPVLEGHAAELRSVLESIPLRESSPFAAVRGTHNGRWALVRTEASPDAPLRAGGLPTPMLMCSATIDRSPEPWVGDLLGALGSTADHIWSHCAGWPGGAGPMRYLLDHRVQPMLEFQTWDDPVNTVIDALETRRRLEAFALRSQGLDSVELLDAYRQEFS